MEELFTNTNLQIACTHEWVDIDYLDGNSLSTYAECAKCGKDKTYEPKRKRNSIKKRF